MHRQRRSAPPPCSQPEVTPDAEKNAIRREPHSQQEVKLVRAALGWPLVWLARGLGWVAFFLGIVAFALEKAGAMVLEPDEWGE